MRDIPASAWLAWAGQQPGLIAGTVGANVSLGDPDPDPRGRHRLARARVRRRDRRRHRTRRSGRRTLGRSGPARRRRPRVLPQASRARRGGRARRTECRTRPRDRGTTLDVRSRDGGCRCHRPADVAPHQRPRHRRRRRHARVAARWGCERGDGLSDRRRLSGAAMTASAASVLRGALPPARRFWPALAAGFAAEASAVALLAVSAWLIVRASESLRCSTSRPPSSACDSSRWRARPSATSSASPGTTPRSVSSRRPARVWCAGSFRSPRTGSRARDAARCSARSSTTSTTCRTCRCGSCSRSCRRRRSPSRAVVFVAFVWWPAALTLLACLVVAGLVATLWGWAAGARAERDIAPLRATLADAILDHLGSLDVLTAYGAEAQSRERDRVRRRGAPARGHAARRRAGRAPPPSSRSSPVRHRSRRCSPAAPAAASGSLDAPAARGGRPHPDGRVRGVRVGAARGIRVAAGALVGAAHRRFGAGRAARGRRRRRRSRDRRSRRRSATASRCAARRCDGRDQRMPRSGTSISTSVPASACSSSARAARASRRSRTRWCASSRRMAATRIGGRGRARPRGRRRATDRRAVRAAADAVRRGHPAESAVRARDRDGRRARERARPRRARRVAARSAAVSTRGSASAARSSRAVRRSASRSRGHCCAAFRCSCSTSRPPASTPRHPMPCSPTC